MKSLFLGQLMLAAVVAFSQFRATAEKLEYKQCVAIALAQNPELAISRAQIEQAEAAVRQAQGNKMPRVNLSLTATRSNDALNAFGMKLGQRNATFGDFGAGEFNPANPNVLAVRAARSEPPQRRQQLQHPHRTAGAGLQRRHGAKLCRYRQSLCACGAVGRRSGPPATAKHVLMAYQGVHTARAYIKLAEEARVAAEEYVRISDKLHKQGMVVKSDVLSAKVNLEDVKVKGVEAKNAEAAALNQLALLMGKSLDDPLDVGAPVTPEMLAGSPADLRAQALNEHAGLRALRNQVEGAGAQVGAARAGKKPQFNVMLRQDWNDENLGLDASSYTVAGVLSWSAFDGGVNNANIDRAAAQRAELVAKLRQAEEGIGYQVTDARRKALGSGRKNRRPRGRRRAGAWRRSGWSRNAMKTAWRR
jgi:outer membrane protein